MNIRNRKNNIKKIRDEKRINTSTLISKIQKKYNIQLDHDKFNSYENETEELNDDIVEILLEFFKCSKDELFPKIEVKEGKREKSNILIVVDTCVLMKDNNFIKDNIDKYELIILDTVVEELSKNKNNPNKENFKDAINALNKIDEYNLSSHKSSRGKNNDERIYNSAEELAKQNPEKDVILFTYDSDYVKFNQENNKCKVINNDAAFKKYFSEKQDVLTEEEIVIYNLIKNNDKSILTKDLSKLNLNVCGIDKMPPISYCIKNKFNEIIDHIIYNCNIDYNKVDLTDNGYENGSTRFH